MITYYEPDKKYKLTNGDWVNLRYKKLNIFVGPNNSGKSRFLRNIFSNDGDRLSSLLDWERFVKELNELRMSSVKPDTVPGKLITELFRALPKGLPRLDFEIQAKSVLDSMASIPNTRRQLEYSALVTLLERYSGQLRAELPLRIYIPMLRGLKRLTPGENELLYSNRTKDDYFKGAVLSRREIFTGENLYFTFRRKLLGRFGERKSMQEFESFLSEKFFEGKRLTITPEEHAPGIKICFGEREEQERFIQDVGDGINSIIILLYQLYEHRGEDLILFLEEPELTLHPFAQRIVVEAFLDADMFPRAQVFVTTHSNHFLDLAADYPDQVQILTFKQSGEDFEVSSRGQYTEVASVLGIRNSSVFLANCCIWTEGVTDRMFLRVMLQLYWKTELANKNKFLYKEDLHYTFSEYGGGNLANFDFMEAEGAELVRARFLNNKNFLIADNDAVLKGKKFDRRKLLERLFGENFDNSHVEIENLIPYGVWDRILPRIILPNASIQLKQDRSGESAFDERRKVEKIGVLLKEFFIEKKNGGTLKYFDGKGVGVLGLSKKEIMTTVCAEIASGAYTIDDFPEAKTLVRKCVNFIARSNA